MSIKMLVSRLRQQASVTLVAIALIGVGSSVARSDSAPEIRFRASALKIPGFTVTGNVGGIGRVHPPATDYWDIIYKSIRLAADGRPEQRNLQIAIAAAPTTDEAWKVVRGRWNAPFCLGEPLKGFLIEPAPDAQFTGHTAQFPAGTYAVGAANKNYAVTVTNIGAGPEQDRALTDHDLELTEATATAVLEWAESSWSPNQPPLIRFVRPPTVIDLKTTSGAKVSGFQTGSDRYVAVADLSRELKATTAWHLRTETLEFSIPDMKVILLVNSRELAGSLPQGTRLFRAIRWHDNQCWVSLEDADNIFHVRYLQ